MAERKKGRKEERKREKGKGEREGEEGENKNAPPKRSAFARITIGVWLRKCRLRGIS